MQTEIDQTHRTGPVPIRMAVIIASVLMTLATLVAFPATSSAQTAQPAVPTFVSPTPGEPVVTTTLNHGNTIRVIDVEIDLAGLDIASGWLFLNGEARVHMGTSNTARTTPPGYPLEAEPYRLQYAYREAGSSSWNWISQTYVQGPGPRIWGTTAEGQFFAWREVVDFTDPVTIIAEDTPEVESSWLVAGTVPGYADLGAVFLGTDRTQATLQVAPDRGVVWFTYYYRINGIWYSVTMLIHG